MLIYVLYLQFPSYLIICVFNSSLKTRWNRRVKQQRNTHLYAWLDRVHKYRPTPRPIWRVWLTPSKPWTKYLYRSSTIPVRYAYNWNSDYNMQQACPISAHRQIDHVVHIMHRVLTSRGWSCRAQDLISISLTSHQLLSQLLSIRVW